MVGSVFDIETDGLNATKIHCMSVQTKKGVISTTNYDDMRKFLSNANTLVGHNIIRYDVPTLEKLLDIKIKAKLIDTLALSWYLEPNRPKHGLESYGDEYKRPKPKIDDWQNLTSEEYIHRCSEDVEINTILWHNQFNSLVNLYGSEEEALRLVEYLSFKLDCAAEQEKYGWKLDVPKATEVMDRLTDEHNKKTEELKEAMPQVAVMAKKTKPKKPYKITGEPSATGKAWFDLLQEQGLPPEYEGSVEYIKEWKEPNPNSSEQIKNWLYSHGWKPATFKHVREDDGYTRKIPQIQKDKAVGEGLCDSVLRLIDKEPKIAVLEGLSIISHRLALIKGLLENADERGYVRAEVAGFTNTLRFKHKVVVNLPSVDKPYGNDIRGCLVCPDGYELLGSDMNSLEDLTGRHYMFAYDPQYVEEMNAPGFDPHLDLAYHAGRINENDVKDYVGGNKTKLVTAIRKTFKTVNYACKYGAGGPKIALTLGVSNKEGYDLHEAYWERNWSVRSVADATESKVCNGSMWLFNPISKLWYSLRNLKDKFSTLNQGTGVWCFDLYLKYIRENGPPVIGQFHDELIALVRVGHRDRVTAHVKEAIRKVNEELRLNVQLGVGIDYGNNYGEIH